MNSQTTNDRLETRLLAIAAIIACLPLFAAAASAQSTPSQGFTDPAEIDRAVTQFTGVTIGEVGGARVPADRRLRLAACMAPLDVAWHGRNRSTVQVACAGPESWRIFIATRPAPQSAQIAPIVSRGDPITVVVRGRGFTVQQSGEALDNGTIGDWIGVRIDRDATPIRARIERPGLAIIPAG
ncbi:flagella basal body P-ring formation protein FlgA [Erythrobacter sp. Alg231-14]|uniref:flagella basal body P-ring formation protein FlgA n=1 Tax=Erythrobacter sp. Alg231-14 TaxID=1922225 RepID=UPI000D55CBB5